MNHTPPALVPELAVRNWQASVAFYHDLLGFSVTYDRPDEGFAYLRLGHADLMIDQIGKGRSFGAETLPDQPPFGRGMNLQIAVPDVMPLLAALDAAAWPLYLELEDRWYRQGNVELGNRQFIVADPDGYLLRFFQDLGQRPCPALRRT